MLYFHSYWKWNISGVTGAESMMVLHEIGCQFEHVIWLWYGFLIFSAMAVSNSEKGIAASVVKMTAREDGYHFWINLIVCCYYCYWACPSLLWVLWFLFSSLLLFFFLPLLLIYVVVHCYLLFHVFVCLLFTLSLFPYCVACDRFWTEIKHNINNNK